MNALILLFYRIVTFFTRVPAETRAEHSDILRRISFDNIITKNSFIDNQSALYKASYGNHSMSENGCGPIALLNALMAFNNSSDKNITESLTSVVEFLEKYGATLKGAFGTSPFAIRKYLKKEGFSTKVFWQNNKNKLNTFAQSYSGFISLIYNDRSSISHGLHIVFTKKNDDGSYTSHNPLTEGLSLYDTLYKCADKGLKHVYTIGIK